MIGLFHITTYIACKARSLNVEFSLPNFFFSKVSRTNDFTTRMPIKFSWSVRLMPSVACCNFLKRGKAVEMMSANESTKIGTATMNTRDNCALILTAKKMAKINIIGARAKIRIVIMAVFWMLLTSLVIRVIKEAFEKWSMFLKEKAWIFFISAERNSAATPVPAIDANFAPRTPAERDTIATRTIINPCCTI